MSERSSLGRKLAALGLLTLSACLAAPAAAGAAEACWTPAELAAKPGEERPRGDDSGALRRFSVSQDAPADADPVSPPLAPGAVVRRVQLPEGDRRIALTFDLCEQTHEIAGYDGRIVDALRAAGAKATFFAGGKWLLTHAERARQLMADPLFEIGSHGLQHRNVRLLRGQALLKEILAPQTAYALVRRELAERQCLDRSGEQLAEARSAPRPVLIRFPYGSCNEAALQTAASAGLTAVEWDFASGDPAPQSGPKSLLRTVLARIRPGSIVVFHANGRGWHTAEALPALIAALRRKGYAFATVSDLLRTPGAKPIAAASCYDQRPGDLDRYDHPAALARAPDAGKASEKKAP